MKKLALSMILGASLMVTSSAFALTAMTDSNMKAATGQAGVSITLDNIVIEQYVGSTTYTDATGTTGTAGSIVISDKHTVKQYLAMTSAGTFASRFATATISAANPTGVAVLGTWKQASALTIDVGTCSVLARGLNDNIAHADLTAVTGVSAAVAMPILMAAGNDYDYSLALYAAANNGVATEDVTGVVIGLPTLLIATSADTYSVGVAKTGALNNGLNFITISKGASAMAILGGTVEIAAH